MSDPTAEMLRERLHYDPETGAFTWRNSLRAKARVGTRAGNITWRGYEAIWIFGKKRASHRLAWLYMTGDWPADQIDHINRNPADNRWANLRVVDGSENCANRRERPSTNLGGRGVTFHKQTGRWQVQVYANKKINYVGLFTTEAEAAAAAAHARATL